MNLIKKLIRHFIAYYRCSEKVKSLHLVLLVFLFQQIPPIYKYLYTLCTFDLDQMYHL